MVLSSPRLTGFAGGPGEIRRIVNAIEDAWLEVGHQRVHRERPSSSNLEAALTPASTS